MNGNSTRRVVVEPGGAGVVAHVGLHALGAFADRLGLGDALSARIPPRGERIPLHDRGKVLVQTVLMLAGGGESCADIEHLRLQEDLFGSVPSDSTVFRTFHEIAPSTRSGIASRTGRGARRGLAPCRRDERERPGDPGHRRLVGRDPHREQGVGGAHVQGRLWLPPDVLLRRCHRRGALSLLRPGNAGANTVADHVIVLDDAVAQLPARSRSVTSAATTRPSCKEPSSCGPTRRGAPRASSVPVGPATSASSSPCARTPRSPGPSSTPSASKRSGSRPSIKTASRERARPCVS